MIPIYITQKYVGAIHCRRTELILHSYYDQEKGKPTGAGSNETHIEDMLFQNFAGTIDEYVDVK